MANLIPAKEVTSKDEVEIETFLQEQKLRKKHSIQDDLNEWKKFYESVKTAWKQKFHSIFNTS